MLLRNQLYAGIIDVPEYGVRGKRGDFEPPISEDLFKAFIRSSQVGAEYDAPQDALPVPSSISASAAERTRRLNQTSDSVRRARRDVHRRIR